MAYPVRKGIPITARFRQVSKVGNWKTCGHHTGTDWACQTGDPVYAVVDGDVRHRSYGPSFGLTVAVSPDGPGEWQYSHLSWAVPNGTRVKAGDVVGRAGTSGGVPPHLHLEWHPNHKNVWRCGIQADPVPEIQRLEKAGWKFPAEHKVYLSYLKVGGEKANSDGVSDSITVLQEMLNRDSLKGGRTLPLVGKYGPETDEEVRLCQAQHGFGADPAGKSFVGPTQADHLLKVSGAPYTIVDDRPKDEDGDGVRFATFNWPPRYADGGKAADQAMWDELAARADVVGLQEAEWARELPGDGWEVHCPVGGDGKRVGQVLAWRKSRFDTVDIGLTLISPATKIQPEAAGPTLHREKHIVWADLRDKTTGQVWNVGVTHFVPSKHLGGAALNLWREQAEKAVAWIERQGQRCVLLGDFNCVRADPDAEGFKRVALLRGGPSHGKRDIDWVAVKKGPAMSSTKATMLPNRGQSDHKPVLATVTASTDPDRPKPEGLRIIDISDHQAGIDLAAVDCDAVIVKATEGKGYQSPTWKKQYQAAVKAGRLVGLYHYARNDLGGATRAVDEADYFVDTIGEGVITDAVLVLDWEEKPLDDTTWVKTWLDRVHARTGVRALVYMSASVTRMADWSAIGENHHLWVAQYGTNRPDPGWAPPNHPTPDVNWPGGWLVWQYTSEGRLPGYAGALDLNIAPVMDADDWAALAGRDLPEPPQPPKPPEESDVTREEYEALVAEMTAFSEALSTLAAAFDRMATHTHQVGKPILGPE